MNPQLLNADAVMTAIRQGYAPGNWRIYHGRAGYHVRQILVGLFVLALGFVAAIYLLLNPHIAFVPGAPGSSGPIDPGPFAVARTVDFVAVALFLLVGFWICVASSSRLPTARDQALVLMPDGFVIATRKPVAYPFAGMQALTARNNRGVVTFRITPVGSAQRQALRLDGRFGNAKQLATQILAARAEWQRVHVAPPQTQPPPAGQYR